MNHGGAGTTETHGSGISTFSCFNVSLQFPAKQAEVFSLNSGRELKGRAPQDLAVRAMADTNEAGIYLSFPLNALAQTRSGNLHHDVPPGSKHLVGEELKYHRVLHAQQHAADFAALARLFPGAESLNNPLAGSNQ